jgi:hypothetical protein
MESPHWSPENVAAVADGIARGASDQAIRPAAMATASQAHLIRPPDPIGLTAFSLSTTAPRVGLSSRNLALTEQRLSVPLLAPSPL